LNYAPLDNEIVVLLDEWRSSSSGDCPLPELYRRLTERHAGLSIGRFHDLLRHLHDSHRVYLHPWTGPLYELPEPPLALLVGHEVAYYASPRISDLGFGISDLKSTSPASAVEAQSEIRSPKSEIQGGSR
jgi:hypothetical protein